MIVRRCVILAIPLWLSFLGHFGRVEGERWSRQVSNSEWIPLADPRASQSQITQSNPGSGLLSGSGSQLPQIQPLSLPPSLQQQYQQQLIQLQKTQENINKLLMLQQQLRTQQQLLQSQAFLPSGFSNPGDDKEALHQSGLISDLTPEVLVPPLPSSEALPPVFPPQNFHQQKPANVPHRPKQIPNVPQEFASPAGQSQFYKNSEVRLQAEQNNEEIGNVESIQENQRQEPKRLKGSSNLESLVQPTALSENTGDGEEEVQLVYVPAETLAQRGQPKRGRGRKPFVPRQQSQQQQQQQQQYQQQKMQNSEPGAFTNDQDAFARQLLEQIQKEHDEKTQFLKDERLKEINRLNEEQRALERKARLQQEALQREQELQRQREAEKKKKELEKLEEMAKQRELERIREAREKQRLEELERRRLAEIRSKEERRREEERQRESDRLANLDRQKEYDSQQALKQQRFLERQQESGVKAGGSTVNDNQSEIQAQALPLVQDHQIHRQHLTEISKSGKSKVRGRQRQRGNHYQEQQNYREPTTTPSPNQPPLSVYMGNMNTKMSRVKVSDVLKILKDAKTIAVLDTVGPHTPKVFVGPTNLEPPIGYAKFDLPYLSSIDHNRVERKVDKLPFFVAPLSFDPPAGYSKIPFPAPHIGSVVVNTLENMEPTRDNDEQNPNPTPLIEPNSYADGLDQNNPDSATPTYESQTTPLYSQEPPSTPKYEATYPPSSPGTSGSRFRFRQYYSDNKPASVISTSYYEDQRPTTKKHKYYDDNLRTTTQSTVPSSRVETSISHSEVVSYSTTPSFRNNPADSEDSPTKEQDLDAQLALINHELAQQRESQRYNARDQYDQSNPRSPTGLSNSFDGDISLGDINDVRAPVGPTQYNLPAELPAISPHLPGLVNSLVDKQEAKLQTAGVPTTTTTTEPTTTTTSTTTTQIPSTTYRPRGRQRTRVVSTRPRTTTQSSSSRTNVERPRRPYNRSRSRFTTTTEDYRESVYEPTKSKTPETTLKYNTIEHRRPTSRTHKYRNRDKTTHQSELLGQGHNVQAPQQSNYDTVSQGDPSISATPDTYVQSSGPETTLRQQDANLPSSNLNEFPQENYPSTPITTTENYPPLPDVTMNHGAPLTSDIYSRNQNYPENHHQDVRYQGSYQESADFEQTALEKTPVNGFNYQAQNEEALDQGIPPRPKEYSQYDGKIENAEFHSTTTEDPQLRAGDEHRYSAIYDVNAPQVQTEYGINGQDQFHHLEEGKIANTGLLSDPNESPIFLPLPQNKQEDYELQISSTQLPITEITTESTTTSTTPVILRQRVRGRVSTRVHHGSDSVVQTRPKGSQDEYVRFSVSGHDSSRRTSGSGHKDTSRTRLRTRPQSHHSQIQTEGNEYIKIHAGHHQRPIATTTPTTTTTTTTESTPEEDIEYGFIRPPSFQPVHPVHPVDNRYHAPVTFRPPLSEIPSQSLLPNDETAVESSPPQTQILKTRQKYQQTPNRRPGGKSTTLPATTTSITETSTSTKRIPAATTLPVDDTSYTVRSKSRNEESKVTRTRGRVRRPGKKRITTTSTTESALEAHNELPLDENYPRITPRLPTAEHPSLYDENYEGSPQYSSAHESPTQFYDPPTSENYPSQDFILNFGNLPDQTIPREEYDQTQLASNPPRKYSHSNRVRPPADNSQSTTADIYGAESQWSTKLTRTSFQPSFTANQVIGELKKGYEWDPEKNAPEIITASPDVSSVTVIVSSDLKQTDDITGDEESMLMGTTVFGKKTNPQDHTERLNATTVVTSAPTLMMRDRTGSDVETTLDVESWMIDRIENSTESETNVSAEKTTKKSADTLTGRKSGRRRRVRVRVRPVVDDFVTAESQHFNSAVNSLIQNQHKYNPIREPKTTTVEPLTTVQPQKSVLQDFLEEILRNDEMSVPVRATSTSTELPEDAWTMSLAMTTPIVISDEAEETTLKEDQVTTLPTMMRDKDNKVSLDEGMTSAAPGEAAYKHREFQESVESSKENKESSGEKSIGDVKYEKKAQNYWRLTLLKEGKNTVDAKSSLSDSLVAEKYTKESNDVNKSDGSSEEVGGTEKLLGNRVNVPDTSIYTESFGMKSIENASTSPQESADSKNEGNYRHPKNHRSKWSEVRFPSSFDHSQVAPWSYDTKGINSKSSTSIPGIVTKNEGESSVKTLSDYVKAIFDTMKSTEETESIDKATKPEETTTTKIVLSDNTAEFSDNVNTDFNIETIETTTMPSFTTEVADTMKDPETKEEKFEARNTMETTLRIDLPSETALDGISTTLATDTETSLSVSSDEVSVTDPSTTTTTIATTTNTGSNSNSTESILGKVLRTSTTTKVSHMTEICYRGRCVMTRPKRDNRSR